MSLFASQAGVLPPAYVVQYCTLISMSLQKTLCGFPSN